MPERNEARSPVCVASGRIAPAIKEIDGTLNIDARYRVEVVSGGGRGRSGSLVRDIVGLYLNPPQAAVVLCADEKTQIQIPAIARARSRGWTDEAYEPVERSS